ncbi:ubiquitin-like-conjugating enzyme ATG10 isoform X3 [Phycodurus eques]|uniref:ubiquitin-like-conjugating enzyme ATG10 isoform X3 n=1 Tax=Phycodurus eques TaxID=693459 RepID=UPI002ACD376B|nr:ubiquitin-like-conjugating enzyme ATG10 isoform X3 [Phycodurus eques]
MSSCLRGEENFRRCCQSLLKMSDQLGDGWSWEPVQGSEEGYMRKTALRSVFMESTATWNGDSSEGAAADETGVYGTNDDCDHEYEYEEGFMSGGSSHVLCYEYHILYSCSYMTPVLYFRASTLDGRSLSLDEVWSSAHPNFRLRLQHSPLTTITQQDRGIYETSTAVRDRATKGSELHFDMAQCGRPSGGFGGFPEVFHPAASTY